jgi:hypothetical protein
MNLKEYRKSASVFTNKKRGSPSPSTKGSNINSGITEPNPEIAMNGPVSRMMEGTSSNVSHHKYDDTPPLKFHKGNSGEMRKPYGRN